MPEVRARCLVVVVVAVAVVAMVVVVWWWWVGGDGGGGPAEAPHTCACSLSCTDSHTTRGQSCFDGEEPLVLWLQVGK